MKKVLVVDDSATVRQVLKITLKNAGYDVLEAKDSDQALSSLAANVVELLVTDLNMPGMDGIELIKNVRLKPGHRFLPIIMLTTESQPQRKLQGKAAGASGWLTKPFHPENILSIVRTICPA
jgi:two-component system chemotaxis response regulator CheY